MAQLHGGKTEYELKELICEIGRGRKPLEKAHPKTPFVWLDTELSQGEVFWIARADLPGKVGHARRS